MALSILRCVSYIGSRPVSYREYALIARIWWYLKVELCRWLILRWESEVMNEKATDI